MTSPQLPSGRPRQARAVQTAETVLRVSLEILLDDGWAAFTIGEVSRRSGISVGGIYQHFKDKNSIFSVLHDRHLDALDERVGRDFEIGRWRSEASTRDLVHGVVETLGEIFVDFGDVNGVMLINSPRVPGLVDRGVASVARLRDCVTAALATRADEYSARDARVAISVAYRMATSTFIDFSAYHRYPGFEYDMPWKVLIETVADAITGLLLGVPAERQSGVEG